jgi:ATP:cob(I)alamin adenosyltransferase
MWYNKTMIKEKNPKKTNKNTLYTGFGDNGTTTLFHCDQGRISKSANIIEALGSLDELNAYLGIVKVYSDMDISLHVGKLNILIGRKKISYSKIIKDIQEVLFIIQAQVAGSKMFVSKKHIKVIENIISVISELLPPVTSFTISGGSIISAELDFSRTLARRAERRIVQVEVDGIKVLNSNTIIYMNRLSSVLFAMSRYSNYVLSIPEDHPKYNR